MEYITSRVGRLLKARQLLRVISAQSVSTFANQVVAFVIPWLVLARTGSALDAGGVAFAMGAAAVVGTIFGGVIVDRIGGRKTSIISDSLSLATVILLPLAIWLDFLPIWLIVVTQVLGTLFDGPGAVAKDTLVPITAKEEKIPLIRASSVQESLQGMAMFAGPVTAGVMVALVGEAFSLLFVGLLFLVCIFLVRGLHHVKITHEHPMTARKAYEDLREGLVYLLKEPLLGPLTILSSALVGVFMPLSTVILPAWFVFAGQSSEGLGLFLGLQAIGWVVGGVVFATISTKITEKKWLLRWLLGSNAAFSVGYLALLLTVPGSLAALVVSFLVGATSAGWMPIFNTVYYSRTPEHLFGRVNGAAWAAMLFVTPFASLFFGWLISVTSAGVAIAVAASSTLALTIVMAMLPAMKLLDEIGQEAESSP